MSEYITISGCEICSHLPEKKHPLIQEHTLPDISSRLVLIKTLTQEKEWSSHVKRCPLCGTYYHYFCYHESHIDGGNDEEELIRLTAAESRRLLNDEDSK